MNEIRNILTEKVLEPYQYKHLKIIKCISLIVALDLDVRQLGGEKLEVISKRPYFITF